MKFATELLIGLLYLPVFILLLFLSIKQGTLLGNYAGVLRETRFLEALFNTLAVGIAVAFINLAVGAWLGKKLAGRQELPGFILDTVVTAPLIVPLFLMLSFLHIFMIKSGVIDNMAAVILIHLVPSLPYSIKICRNGYGDLGNKYFEQAALMGAGKIRVFFEISLPLLKSTYQYAFALSFAISIGQYATTAIIGGGSVITLSMMYFPFFNSLNSGYMSAFSLIFIALPLFVVLLFKILYDIINLITGRL